MSLWLLEALQEWEGANVLQNLIWNELIWHHSNNYLLQSWTKVLTHLSKTNAFYPRPCVNSNNIFFTYSLTPSPPFQCWNTLRWHCHVVTTLKRGEGVEKWKFEIEKLTRLTKQVFFEECLNCFCPWLSELHFTQYEAFRASLLFRRAPVECNYYVT